MNKEKRKTFKNLFYYILLCIIIIGYMYNGVYIHEYGHYLAGQLFGLDSSIIILDISFNFGDIFKNNVKIAGYTHFPEGSIESLSFYKQIIIFLSGVSFEIFIFGLLLFIYLKIFKMYKDVIIITFILYSIIMLYYNLIPLKNDIKNDGSFVVEIIKNKIY